VYSDHCFKCNTGFYLDGSSCHLLCPIGYSTDTLRGRCVEDAKVVTAEVVYTKSYTRGSCRNTCGLKMSDCSCQQDCKLDGTCCSDYERAKCSQLLNTNSTLCMKNTNNTCQYCDESTYVNSTDNNETSNSTSTDTNETNNTSLPPICRQCVAGLFYYRGECLSACPENYTSYENNLCLRKTSCQVDNCRTCEGSDENPCKKCRRGSYLYDGKCVASCPSDYRADRMSWTCLEMPVFAWYWVYPSRTSCKSHCGVVVEESWDCSCQEDCVFFGNCCQDIEDYCPDVLFWRKKGYTKKGIASRKTGNLKKEKVKIVKKAEIEKKK